MTPRMILLRKQLKDVERSITMHFKSNVSQSLKHALDWHRGKLLEEILELQLKEFDHA